MYASSCLAAESARVRSRVPANEKNAAQCSLAHTYTHTHSHTNYGAASQSELCSHISAAALHMYSSEKRDEATGRHDKEMRGNRKERDFRKITVARGKKYKTFNLHFHTQHYYSFYLKNQ